MPRKLQLAQAAASLLILTGVLATGLVPGTRHLAFDELPFRLGLGLLYLIAGGCLWRRARFGAYVAGLLIVAYGFIATLQLRFPPVELMLTYLPGPILALAAWQELRVRARARSTASIVQGLVVGTVVLALGLLAPLWHCHEGFGGVADYHCHSMWFHKHEH